MVPAPPAKPDAPNVRDRLLDGAVEAAADVGLAKLSMGDAARRAGLSRQTLYRYFPTREALVFEAVSREVLDLARQVNEARTGIEDPARALEVSLAAALGAARTHPLLDRLLRTEPEALLPLVTTEGGPVLRMVRVIVDEVLGEHSPLPEGERRRRLADVIARLLISYATTVPDESPEAVAAGITELLMPQLNRPAG